MFKIMFTFWNIQTEVDKERVLLEFGLLWPG